MEILRVALFSPPQPPDACFTVTLPHALIPFASYGPLQSSTTAYATIIFTIPPNSSPYSLPMLPSSDKPYRSPSMRNKKAAWSNFHAALNLYGQAAT